ncbi:MAG: hypothetical protein Q4D85_04690 [Corynebacterium sp.]|uniref:hypothetical protein n=1 Tax=Corynebacterium sp. TaxID=1720 RepID=UPI0026DD806A|nr:hypothetical protein [Corynebacterium sp.]MDO5098036.1 hypothetical protein [Corynebacterium sp.]
MISSAEVGRRMVGYQMPAITLDEFFNGNNEEESIAPNQWGFGRPPLAEIESRLRAINACDDVAWVRIETHPDTEMEEENGIVAAESAIICTSAFAEDIEARVGNMEQDGVCELPAKLKEICDIPAVPDGYRIVFVLWD